MIENSKENKGKMREYNFKPGKPGGPGRGHKKAHKIDDLGFWQATEEMIRDIMKSSDESNRLKGVTLYLKWQALKAKSDAQDTEGSIIDPSIKAALGSAVEKILSEDLPEFDEGFLDE